VKCVYTRAFANKYLRDSLFRPRRRQEVVPVDYQHLHARFPFIGLGEVAAGDSQEAVDQFSDGDARICAPIICVHTLCSRRASISWCFVGCYLDHVNGAWSLGLSLALYRLITKANAKQ